MGRQTNRDVAADLETSFMSYYASSAFFGNPIEVNGPTGIAHRRCLPVTCLAPGTMRRAVILSWCVGNPFGENGPTDDSRRSRRSRNVIYVFCLLMAFAVVLRG